MPVTFHFKPTLVVSLESIQRHVYDCSFFPIVIGVYSDSSCSAVMIDHVVNLIDTNRHDKTI